MSGVASFPAPSPSSIACSNPLLLLLLYRTAGDKKLCRGQEAVQGPGNEVMSGRHLNSQRSPRLRMVVSVTSKATSIEHEGLCYITRAGSDNIV